MMSSRIFFASISFAIGILFSACNKKENPFYNPNSQSIETVTQNQNADPATITGLHQRIFATKCANPGCHDGSFEPDFRTVQSTYSSTVFHPVVKNDTILNFQFRVTPFDTARSWLWYRVTTHDTVLGRMPLYAPPLNSEELRNLSTWIMSGARDVNGKIPDPPNFPPVFEWYIARDVNNTDLHANSNRLNGWSSSFKAPRNQIITFRVKLKDDSTQVKNLQINRIKLSTSDVYTNPIQTIQAIWDNSFWGGMWTFQVNTTGLPQNTPIYFQYEVADTSNSGTTFYPRIDDFSWRKRNASFIIQ